MKLNMLKRHITPERVNNAMVAISKIRDLTMMDPNKKISIRDLETRQLFCRQLMNLKVKGKFLEETEAFVEDVGQAPSKESMRKMLKGLSYQAEDEYEDFAEALQKPKSMYKKQLIINQRINQEFFYYNPAYKVLMRKKNQIIKESTKQTTTLGPPPLRSVLSL